MVRQKILRILVFPAGTSSAGGSSAPRRRVCRGIGLVMGALKKTAFRRRGGIHADSHVK